MEPKPIVELHQCVKDFFVVVVEIHGVKRGGFFVVRPNTSKILFIYKAMFSMI